MILVTTALLVLLLVAVGLLILARGQRRVVAQLDDLAGRTQPVDMQAFQNLISPAETEFLNESLPPSQFRIVQRERTLAAAEYVRHIAHNAGVLIQLGQAARSSPDPQVAAAAQAMVESAARVRMMSTLVLMKLYAASFVPVLPFSGEGIWQQYQTLTEAAVLFTRLQRPAFAGRVGAML